jgi:hypothetical protein
MFSIKKLVQIFESFEIKAQKSLLLARYLVEPKTGSDIIFDENLQASL